MTKVSVNIDNINIDLIAIKKSEADLLIFRFPENVPYIRQVVKKLKEYIESLTTEIDVLFLIGGIEVEAVKLPPKENDFD